MIPFGPERRLAFSVLVNGARGGRVAVDAAIDGFVQAIAGAAGSAPDSAGGGVQPRSLERPRPSTSQSSETFSLSASVIRKSTCGVVPLLVAVDVLLEDPEFPGRTRAGNAPRGSPPGVWESGACAGSGSSWRSSCSCGQWGSPRCPSSPFAIPSWRPSSSPVPPFPLSPFRPGGSSQRTRRAAHGAAFSRPGELPALVSTPLDSPPCTPVSAQAGSPESLATPSDVIRDGPS